MLQGIIFLPDSPFWTGRWKTCVSQCFPLINGAVPPGVSSGLEIPLPFQPGIAESIFGQPLSQTSHFSARGGIFGRSREGWGGSGDAELCLGGLEQDESPRWGWNPARFPSARAEMLHYRQTQHGKF